MSKKSVFEKKFHRYLNKKSTLKGIVKVAQKMYKKFYCRASMNYYIRQSTSIQGIKEQHLLKVK
ncbi:hypothetical protein pb186bvf_013410 [Paramecium bursaria]